MDIDRDIRETELRLAWRRHQLDHGAHELARTALRKLASPAALAGVALAGFILGGTVAGRRHSAQRSALKTSGFTGLLLSGALALLRARFANPAAIMELYSKFKRKSSPSDTAQRERAQPSPRETFVPRRTAQAR